MIDAGYCQVFAAYNAWMNEKIFACAAQLSDEERKRDRGAFFRSIHSTLNHVLWGDRLWLGRLNGRRYEVGPIGVDLYEDFDRLRLARMEMDAEITDWALHVSGERLAGTLTWFSVTAQRETTRPLALCVMQMFNHQTHHRGQVTTLLKQAGIDPGVTDLPWAPLARDTLGRVILADEYAL
ncbi:MAG: DinB family protein [Burkholderiaceae bacterium]|nr:DinB family protein [Burkholderiaceae bacterium]